MNEIIITIILVTIGIIITWNFKPKDKKKAFYQRLIDKIEEGRWNGELRIIVLKQIREGIRQQFDKISDVIKGFEDNLEKLRLENPRPTEKINKLQDEKHKYELDADKMKEQMMGKAIKDRPDDPECVAEYHGGIDEEIKSIEQNLIGGDEFKKVIEKELKKL
jgi:hypothetical protein